MKKNAPHPNAGKNPTLTQARAIADKIKSEAQAREAILIVLSTLRRAADSVRDRSWFDRTTQPNVTRAWQDRIAQQIDRVSQLQRRPFDRQLANAIGLSIVQSAELLRGLKAEVAETNRSMVQVMVEGLLEGIKALLESAARNLLDGSIGSLLLVALAALYLSSNNRRS